MTFVLYGWPYAGLVFAALLLFRLFNERRPAAAPPRWQDPAFVLPLLWPMYLLHQFEEHGIDLMGRHFPFLTDLCATLGHADVASCPADAAFVFVVNVVACPVAFVMPLIRRRTQPLLAAWAWCIPLVNCVAHIASAIIHGSYNAGALTSVVLFVPLGIWMLRVMLRAGQMHLWQVPLLVLSGVLVHAILLGSVLARDHGELSHTMLLVINAANGAVPLACGVGVLFLGSKRVRR